MIPSMAASTLQSQPVPLLKVEDFHRIGVGLAFEVAGTPGGSCPRLRLLRNGQPTFGTAASVGAKVVAASGALAALLSVFSPPSPGSSAKGRAAPDDRAAIGAVDNNPQHDRRQTEEQRQGRSEVEQSAAHSNPATLGLSQRRTVSSTTHLLRWRASRVSSRLSRAGATLPMLPRVSPGPAA